MKKSYEIMHGNKITARIHTQGQCVIYEPDFMPYNLFLDDTEEDIDTLVSNITNFYY